MQKTPDDNFTPAEDCFDHDSCVYGCQVASTIISHLINGNREQLNRFLFDGRYNCHHPQVIKAITKAEAQDMLNTDTQEHLKQTGRLFT